jgi:hypothetical protein
LNPRLVFTLLATLLAGCATGYPPADRPAPGPDTAPESTSPPPPEIEPDPPAPAPPPRANTQAPTLALLRQSERSADGGDLDGAIAYVERAIRLNPRDPALWLRLGQLQLDAGRPERAEQLGHKTVSLSDEQNDQERAGWLLVADALDAQGEAEEAARIRARWRTFKG